MRREDKGKNITYSCLYGTAKDDSLSDYGTGCIAKDPCFADAASGDFHLKSAAGRWNGTTWVKDTVTSPCIDAGETSAAYANEPSPNGNRANMGAYGNTAEASKSTSGGSTDPSIHPTRNRDVNIPVRKCGTKKRQPVQQQAIREILTVRPVIKNFPQERVLQQKVTAPQQRHRKQLQARMERLQPHVHGVGQRPKR